MTPSQGWVPSGSQWQKQQPQRPESTALVLIGVGGGLLALSPFLPWVNIIFIGSLDLFTLTRAAHNVEILPYAMLLAGLGLAIAVLTRAVPISRLAIAATIAVVTAVVFGGGDFVELVRVADQARGLVDLGAGFYTAVGALILLSVGAVMGRAALKSKTWMSSPRRAPVGPWQSGPPPGTPPMSRLPATPPGWYPDPAGSGSMRWWDGRTWGQLARPQGVTQEPPADRTPGWKSDPWGPQGRTRYWDGTAWTSHTS
jgi:Protein of unknown function (DUF2510)